jgi:hypothetical protein
MPTVAGILDICAGASSLVGGTVLAFLALAARSIPYNVSEPVPEWPFVWGFAMFFGLSMMLFAIGLLAVVGGIYAIGARRSVWPIIGAIAATLSCFPLGIAAIILTVMWENETSRIDAVPGPVRGRT